MDNVLTGGRQSALLQPPKPMTSLPAIPRPPVAAPPPPAKKKDTGYRSIFDPVATRTAIFEDVRQAARDTPEISNQRHILRLKDVDYDGDPRYDYTAQKKAILANKSLNRRLLGTWELVDKADGRVLDQKRMTVAHVPYMTERGTFINNGLEYIVKNQMRLRPGVFARVKENGEVESHANIMPGKGFGHRYYLDPAKQTFYMKVHQAKIPLMPLMRALGATDKQLIEAWGPGIFAANQLTDGVAPLHKLYDKVMGDRGKDTDPVARRQAIADAFNKMEIDPDVMQRTLGRPHKNLNLDAVLDVTKKLLGISRGEQDVDDRDHMAYQTVHGVEDLMAERIARDFGNLRRNLLYKASFKGNLKPIQPGALSRQINAVLLSSGLGQPLEELNPSEILDKLTAITRLGVGGIGDTDAIPRESRSVQPSHYGFLDLVRTPESLRAGVDIYLGAAVRKGKNGQIYAPFKDARTGETVWKSPHELADLTVAFPGEMNRRTKRIGAMRGGKMDFYPRNEVDLIQDNFENSFSPLAQFVLGKSAMKAQRMSMGSRMSTQAVSLTAPESPLVQVGTLDRDKDESFEERYAPFMGAVKAKQPGRVVKVEKDRIDVRYADGTKETVPLYNNFIFNRKSVTGSTEILIKRADNQIWRGPIAEYEWFSGDRTVSHDPATFVTSWQRVTGFLGFRSDKPLIRVTTRSGRFVDITEDHSLVTLGPAGDLIPVTAAECTPGVTKLPVTVRLFRNERNFSEHSTRQGILVGLYLAEGHINTEGLVSIACKPAARQKEILGLLGDLGINGYVNGGNVCFTDAVWGDFLQRHCGRLAHAKFASDYFLQLSGAFRRGVIAGYLSGDGNMWSDSNGTPQVTGVSVSKTLRNNLVDILASLGVFCTLFDAPRQHLSEKWRDAYGFRISNSYLKMLPAVFYADRQKSLRSRLRTDSRSSPFEMVPLPLSTRQAKKSLYQSLGKVSNSVYQSVHKGSLSKKVLAKSDGPFGYWGRSDIVWDEIETIEQIPEEEFVYDLSVEGSETFSVNNGLLVHNSYIHNTPVVRPGDAFQAGQLLAKSNYTDNNGVTALGLNARTGYMPYKGFNFEDAIVISRGMADRMKSEHAYQHSFERDDAVKHAKRDFLSLFPGKFDRSIMDRMDDDGVIKEGQTVNYGEPLILAARRRDDAQNKLHKKKQSSYSDATELWTHHSPGVVTDVMKTERGILVAVKSATSMQVGDKMSGRFGDKGVIAAIVDDDKMPRGEDGQPLEVLTNDLGIISRANPIQIYEALLGKIARKSGKPIKLQDFSDISDLNDWVVQQCKKYNIKAMETITDPENNRQIPNILTGDRFFMKLAHMSDDKLAGRGTGGYTANEQPAKGGPEGCFLGHQKITTILGPMSIARICEKRLSVQVRTFSETLQEWVYRPVTNWFIYDAPIENVLAVTFNGPCESHGKTNLMQRTSHTIYPTKNHQVLMFDGSRKLAGQLRVGDELVSWGCMPSKMQRAAILGTLLGDAFCNQNSFGFMHSAKQKTYVDWKQSLFSNLLPNTFDSWVEPTIMHGKKVEGRLARSVYVSGSHIAEPLRKLCYSGPGGKKRVTKQWLLGLTGLSVALWTIDDGTIATKGEVKTSSYPAGSVQREKFSGSLCTQGFDRQSVELLQTWLINRYGETCSIGGDNRINLPTKLCRKLLREIARWVPWQVIPKSKGTIRRVVRKLQTGQIVLPIVKNLRLGKVPCRITGIKPARSKHGKPTVKVYDFTAEETHTYCAGPALVSNSKALSLLDVNALLSHGATSVIRDAGLIRGQKNDDLWLSIMRGHGLPRPQVPYVYQRFINSLRAAGINVLEDGPRTHIMAMTDKDVDKLAGDRYVTSGETVDFAKGLAPIKGGLFDVSLTDGHNGMRWSAIKLHEPMPNPIMEEPIRRMLGLTQKKFESILAGRDKLADGSTGPTGIKNALDRLDIDKELAKARLDFASGKMTKRDDAIRKMKYLKSAQKLGLHPRDWMLSKVPVLPARFRPIAVMSGNGLPLVADANYLYKEVVEANDNLKTMQGLVDDVGDERLALYHSFRAVTGLGDPVHPKLQEKRVKGVLGSIFGSSPKHGSVQRKLISSTVDLVGRAVITPNPDYDMDTVGIPEDKAWEVYKPFLVRRLVRRGQKMVQAMQAVADRSPMAKKELLEEMEDRPVIINRAPVLHRFGIMAFRPKLVSGSAMQISPLIVKGFNADFDGDAMQFHVPADDEAVKEAYEKMLPSVNLISPADFKSPVHAPSNEYTGGLYVASTRKSKRSTRTFRNWNDALAAFRRGDLNIDDEIEVLQ